MANEKRLIYLDDLLKFPIRITHYDMVNGNRRFVLGIESVLEYAENLPTVDAVEVKHGRWIDEYPYVRCSECNAEWLNCRTDNEPKLFYYCPNCGADMRERKDNGTV